MVIIEKTSGKPRKVYGIYWVDGKKHYYVTQQYDRVLASLSEEECSVVENSIDGGFYFCKGENDDNNDAFYHWTIYEGGLLNRLLQRDEGAFVEFRKRIDHENAQNMRETGQRNWNDLQNSIRDKNDYLVKNYGITLDELQDLKERMGL